MKEKIIHISVISIPSEIAGDLPIPRTYGLGNQGNLYILIDEKIPRWELYVSCDNIG